MQIYLDVDDTLADFRGHAIANGVPPWTGTWYTQDPATWSDEQRYIQKRTNELMSTPEFWLTMPVVPGAFELMTAAQSRCETYLLTALPSFAKDEKMQNMIRQAKIEYLRDTLHFPANRVIICQRKDKVRYARYYGSNILVDDANQNCAEWRDAGGIAIIHNSVPESIRHLKVTYDHGA